METVKHLYSEAGKEIPYQEPVFHYDVEVPKTTNGTSRINRSFDMLNVKPSVFQVLNYLRLVMHSCIGPGRNCWAFPCY